jgi:cytochrome c oxidase assembly protein subunit 15
MTGSGMGCPDWPKCFGYLIPPTTEAQITWQANTDYKTGMIIIKDETLYVAQKNIKTYLTFSVDNWKKYTKHNYAKFNKYHTWTEYINRLSSAVAGIFFLFLIFSAAKFWKERKEITILAFLAFFLMLVEAWMGKMVIDSNLKPTIITIHMIGGLLIIALLLRLRFIISEKSINSIQEKKPYKYHSLFSKLLIISAIFSLIQIAM